MNDNLEFKKQPSTVVSGSTDWPLPPLGICSLGAVFEKANMPVELVDCNISTKSEIVDRIERADIVGISAPSLLASDAVKLARYAKQRGKITIIGGPHATISPTYFLRDNSVDFVIKGEGEYTLLELVQRLNDGESWNDVEGICYAKDNAIVENPARPPIKNLDELPFPAMHLLPVERYLDFWKRKSGRSVLHMVSSRGCPYACIFCAKEIFGRFYRARSATLVVDEMEQLLNRYNVDEIYFNDDIFTLNKRRVLQICEEIKKRRLDVNWTCESRVNTVDYELLKAIKEAGCKTIYYGVESGSQRVLDFLNKNITVDQIKEATRLTKKIGIFVVFYIILGAPCETKEDINLTKKLIFQTKPDLLYISFFTPLPGTKAWQLLEKEILSELELSSFDYHKQGLIFSHRYLSNEELKKIKKDFQREFKIRLILRSIASPHQILYGLQNFREVLSALRTH